MPETSAEAELEVSLIICTRDRCRQLARCLESLRLIVFHQPWELILVDNASRDETAAVIRGFIEHMTIPVLYLLETTPGLGSAHNAALGLARGKILAFTDDDCYPEPDFLTRVHTAFKDPSVGYIAGRITLYDPSDHPTTIIECDSQYTFPARSLVRPGTISGANMAFRRNVLFDIGGFDPWFGPGSLFNAEDVDAAGRASAIGWKGVYCPDVIVRHHHGRKARDIPRLVKSYGIGIGAYHMKILLRDHNFYLFAKGVYLARRRYEWSRRAVMWEPVGAAKYAFLYLMHLVKSRFTRMLGRR